MRLSEGWMDTYHDLEGAGNQPLQMSPLLLSLAGGQEHALGSYVPPGTPREKERSGPLEPELGLLGREHAFGSCVPGDSERKGGEWAPWA